MGAPFDAALRSADAVISATFGWLVEIQPRVSIPLAEPLPDANRSSRVVRGVFTEISSETMLRAQRHGTAGSISFAEIAQTQAQLWLRAAEIEKLGYVPRTDDAVRIKGELWVVVRASPTDAADVVLHIDRESHA